MSSNTLSQTSTRTNGKVAAPEPRAPAAAPKKRRVVRRRGRARGELDSDDEIEREIASDSDSIDDDTSSIDSATDDSDTEPASEDAPQDRAHLPTPRNSKSPETVLKDDEVNVIEGVPSFFAPTGDWSQMVADEKAHGPADLPVIDFTDFGNQAASLTVPTKKPKKSTKSKRNSDARTTGNDSTPKEVAKVDEPATSEPTAPPASRPLNRFSSQSARQAYQHKLETDPSFVPTIGNFWGHDDRLIDSEFRSLSGWWRGRGRGRGRGFAMRGRGGFQGRQAVPGSGGNDNNAVKPEDIPPIERAWTHDGFEDMRRKEEQRRAEAQAARNHQASPKRGTFLSRGGRGKGIPTRGGFTSTSTPHSSASLMGSGRVRFVMKPELVWTKQHEAFLYFDTGLKPRPGQGAGFRVAIPGHEPVVIRTPYKARVLPQASTSKAASDGSEGGEKHFAVRLPKRSGKEREAVPEENPEETPLEEVFTVRPQLVSVEPLPLPQPTIPIATALPEVAQPAEVRIEALPEQVIRSQLENLSMEPQVSDPERQAKTEEAVLRRPNVEGPNESGETLTAEKPALAPIQTVFTPPPPPQPAMAQQSPAYGSPYNYHMALPPGVALNQHGLPFEVATGHPVYLQPPPMYNPRPMMPSHYSSGMPFVPRHMHHPSTASPDFLVQAPPHTPPVNGFIDPATGTPIFSFPRQTSRIEIRAPTAEDSGKGKSTSTPRVSSNLRTTAPTFQPSRAPESSDTSYYQQSETNESASYDAMNGQPVEDVSQPGMMMYPAYQQPYYYPEPYYPQYMDMTGQYEMYNMDQPPQGTVYY
ncbi:hypothetical protein CPC08DRAFT_19747 [Agrocybe pediades]|nr:hypothetical protein CPC08DRAFT_19747 [Agrocybe pediades]